MNSSNCIPSPQGTRSSPSGAVEDGTLARWQSPRPDVTGSSTPRADGEPPPWRENEPAEGSVRTELGDPWDMLASHLKVVLGSILAGPWPESPPFWAETAESKGFSIDEINQYGEYIRPNHVPLFAAGAKQFQVYVLIRKTNAASLEYMGRPGYTGKRLDCKWKTANRDVGFYRLAGLVASPEIQPQAFVGAKLESAWREWRQHQELILRLPEGTDPTGMDLRGSRKPYALQMNPRHKHYGCVVWIEEGILQPRYIHADYDLYALVPAANPRQRAAPRQEEMLGVAHSAGPQWFAFMNWIDQQLGFPMIFHGEQEHFLPHVEDEVIAFFPDGKTIRLLKGKAAIEKFYAVTLGGRQPARSAR